MINTIDSINKKLTLIHRTTNQLRGYKYNAKLSSQETGKLLNIKIDTIINHFNHTTRKLSPSFESDQTCCRCEAVEVLENYWQFQIQIVIHEKSI